MLGLVVGVARGKGEGAVFKRTRDNLWVGTVELPRIDGVRRRKEVSARSKAAVLEKMRAAREELRRNGDVVTSSPTVAEWVTFWLRNIADVRPVVAYQYESMVRTHIIPVLGPVRLNRLTTSHVRQLHKHFTDAGLSSTYARNAHWLLSGALSAAVRDGKTASNPCERVDAPATAKTALDALTVAEAVQVIARCVDVFKTAPYDDETIRYSVALLTGARRGEVLGLEWDRVGDVLDLSWQLQRIPTSATFRPDFEYRHLVKGYYLTRPKTSKSWRIIPLVDPLRTLLLEHRAHAPANRFGLVFTSAARQQPVDPSAASNAWAAYAPTITDKHVRLHDLRHTTVDLLYEAGIPEDLIQEIVGHSTRAMTRRYKATGNLPRLTDAMKQLSAFLGQ